MLDRLLGLETEYAIRFAPDAGSRHPGNVAIFLAIARGMDRHVQRASGEFSILKKQFFVENGGAFNYEALPSEFDGGLIEGATPECRSPSQLLLYQRAQEALLLRALPDAEASLAARGFAGRVALLKNCRDARGNVYGAQENYEAAIATGFRLVLYRLGLAALVPLLLACILLYWAVYFVPALVAGIAAGWAAGVREARGGEVAEAESERVLWRALKPVARHLLVVEQCLWFPVTTPFCLLVRALGFGAVRRHAAAFLVSRSVLSGCGTVRGDDRFELSEKGPAMTRFVRLTINPRERAIIDTGNLLKGLMAPMWLDPRPIAALFRRRQRLQLGLSDSNVAQAAEYLKIGTTALVIDMAEAGWLEDAPRLARPLAALRCIGGDPTLRVAVDTRDGRRMTALELQRYYLERARAYLAAQRAVRLEARDVVRLWGEALDALERDPSTLIGRLDWITKRYLLDRAGPAASAAMLKKVDLRYHELGGGYLARLEEAGIAPRLVTDPELEAAMHEPPDTERARARGRLIRELAARDLSVRVSWDRVRVRGGGRRPRVYRLDDYRAE